MPRAIHWLLPLTVVALNSICSQKAHAMGKMHLFSAVRGVVLLKGKPVAGALVEQDYFWHWKDQRGVAVVKTDASGNFQFPQVTGASFMGSILPHEPVVEQTIRITYEGQDYMAWSHERGNYSANGELAGRSISLLCDLDRAPFYKGPRDSVYGICELRGTNLID